MRPATGESEPSIEKLEERLDNLRISTDSDITIRGSAWQGYAVNIPFCEEIASQPSPPVCPPSISVQFSGITVECGCSMFGPGSGTSFLITDEGDINSFETALSLGAVISSDCGDCGPEGSRLVWLWAVDESPHVVISYWNDADDCTGGPSGVDFNQFTGVIMVRVSGTYYLAMYFLQSLVFLGSTTDLSLPIANILSCDPEFNDYSGEPWGCMFNGIVTPTFDSVGAGGTATVTIL